MELTDKDGKTLKQFLEDYDADVWPHPSLTADIILFSIDEDNKPVVLLIKRGGHPYLGEWAFPGGFVGMDESTEQAAVRELQEETGIVGPHLDQLYTVSTPGRDPRGWTVSVCYTAVMDRAAFLKEQNDNAQRLIAGDDADDAQWFNIDYVRSAERYILKLTCANRTLSAEMVIKRDKMGNIDINNSTVVSSDGIAFDHAKLLLLAIERL